MNPERTSEQRTLGHSLRRLRKARGLTQEELGKRARVNQRSISRIERGNNSPGWFLLRKLLRALDASLHSLAEMVEREEREQTRHSHRGDEHGSNRVDE